MVVAHRRDLRQVRDAQRLLLFRDRVQLARNLLCRVAGNAGVDLVKNQHTNVLARRQDIFERQHDTAQLTARSNLGQRLFRLARIDRNFKRHGVKTMRGKLGSRMHRDAHLDLVHVQTSQFSHDLSLKLCRRLAPLCSDLARKPFGLGKLRAVLLAQGVTPIIRIGQRLEFGRDTVVIGCDLRNRAAVFLFEPIDQVEPLLNPFALGWGKIQIVAAANDAVAQVGGQKPHLFGLLGNRVERLGNLMQRSER